VIKPEISSFLKNQILKEGENIEMKCRLDEEIDVEDVTVTWFFNDKEFTESDRVQITFDGTYAKVFIAGSIPSDAGVYKVKFQNEQGEDETQAKIQVKAAPKVEEADKQEPSPGPPEQNKPVKLDLKKKSVEQKKSTSVVEKKEESEQGEMFKLKKKTSAAPRKVIPKEEEQPAFAGMKLKKSSTVKRDWDDGGLEKVDLKHHEFEKTPEEEQPERGTGIEMTEALPDDDAKKGKKKKKVKKTITKIQGALDEDQESQEGDEEAVTEDKDIETIPETIPVSKRKESQPEPEGASAFGLKLKKSNRRQSQIPEEPKLPTVDLKHHEFEKLPQTEEV